MRNGQSATVLSTAADAELLQRAGVVLDAVERDGAGKRLVRERACGTAPKERGSLGIGLLAIGGALVVFCVLWVLAGMYGRVAYEQGAVTLRESILAVADQCYAVEGAYPRTLDDLEERYALSVNSEDYDVLYDAFASNVAPTVVVRPL